MKILYTRGIVNLHCSITCSSDPFFRDVAARKLAVVGRQCEKNNKNRARTSGKCTLEHIQSTALTENYTKSYPKFPPCGGLKIAKTLIFGRFSKFQNPKIFRPNIT